MLKEKMIVLNSGCAGLGDNLMFSTLPELFSSVGEKCYISSKNPTRNNEISDLVWGSNPYIFGTTECEANAGIIKFGDGGAYKSVHSEFIKSIEILHGFKPTNKYPKIYYKAKPSNLSGICLVDLSCITVTSYSSNISEMVESHLGDDCEKIYLKFPNIKTTQFQTCEPHHNVCSIFEYADLLSACSRYISFHSGGNMLACAVKGGNLSFKNECIMKENMFDKHKNNGNQAMFDNCEYLIEKDNALQRVL
jgi:hypothetical protein